MRTFGPFKCRQTAVQCVLLFGKNDNKIVTDISDNTKVHSQPTNKHWQSATDERPRLGPFFFNFMQFLGKNDQNNRLALPSGKSWIRHWYFKSDMISYDMNMFLIILQTKRKRISLEIDTKGIQAKSFSLSVNESLPNYKVAVPVAPSSLSENFSKSIYSFLQTDADQG